MGTTAKQTAKKIVIIQRRQKALNLRKTGATLEAIAGAIAKEFNLPSYNRSRCFEDIDTSLKDLNDQYTHDTEAMRRQELERLDDYLFRLASKIQSGDVKAIAQAVKISERRCKMLGLDAPIQVQVEDLVNQELTAFIDSLEPLLSKEVYSSVLNAITQIGDRAAVAGSN
jgi:hypothetical protein